MKRKLLITGGSLDQQFVDFAIEKTGKSKPNICFIPTAVGDRADIIAAWELRCKIHNLDCHVLRTFISSYQQKESFEDMIHRMDLFVVYGGNTLNMLAIWKAHGIDKLLKKAYENGAMMMGGSAGSLCWFEEGTTDSRPIDVTKIECLGWIKGSHCPHYHAEIERKPMYHQSILQGKLKAGYACDDYAGIYFENEQLANTVSIQDNQHSYFVECVNQAIQETRLV